MSRPN